MKQQLLLFSFITITHCCGLAQNTAQQNNTAAAPIKDVHIGFTNEKITLDGNLNEAIWQTATIYDGFWRNAPNDTAFATTHTEVRVTFDNKNIYVAAVCYDNLKGNYVQQTLKRDFSITNTDCFAVSLDPTGDHQNGFSFSLSPAGSQREGLIANGGNDGVATAWDQVWTGEAVFTQGKWTCEIAIPFKSIRYNPENKVWGINFAHQDLKRNELSTFQAVPRGLNVSNLAYTARLIWDNPIPKAGANIVINPYVAAGAAVSDYTKSNTPKLTPNAGVDVKIGVSSALNVDLTVNPDFSQVDVDRQVTNLERFSLFFPERRTFFTENSDLLNSLGVNGARPFNSRTIGLAAGKTIPILGGVRLSGKLNNLTRADAMLIQTADDTLTRTAGQNYAIAVVQRKVLANSQVTVFGINKQAFAQYKWVNGDYNRVFGGEFNYNSKNSRWNSKVYYQRVFSETAITSPDAAAVTLTHNGKQVFGSVSVERVGKDFAPSTGFVPYRQQFNAETKKTTLVPYYSSNHYILYQFFPRNSASKILFYGPEYDGFAFLNADGRLIDRWSQFKGFLYWKNGNIARIFYKNYQTLLQFPSQISANVLPQGEYNYQTVGSNFASNQRKTFYTNVEVNYGTFYLAKFLNYKADINYRIQPWGNFSFNIEQNFLNYTDDKYKNERLTLFGAKMEFSFNKNMFLTNYLQYNTQANNFNLNTRFQWRFRPMSDLFLVYSDNYATDVFHPKNRALILKMNYWFAL